MNTIDEKLNYLIENNHNTTGICKNYNGTQTEALNITFPIEYNFISGSIICPNGDTQPNEFNTTNGDELYYYTFTNGMYKIFLFKKRSSDEPITLKFFENNYSFSYDIFAF